MLVTRAESKIDIIFYVIMIVFTNELPIMADYELIHLKTISIHYD